MSIRDFPDPILFWPWDFIRPSTLRKYRARSGFLELIGRFNFSFSKKRCTGSRKVRPAVFFSGDLVEKTAESIDFRQGCLSNL